MESFCVLLFNFDDFFSPFLFGVQCVPCSVCEWNKKTTCKLPEFHLQISNLLTENICTSLNKNKVGEKKYPKDDTNK